MLNYTVSVAVPAMWDDSGISSFDKSSSGKMCAVGNIAYLLGKFMNGPVTDRFGGRFVMLMSVIVPTICLFIFSFSRFVPLFIAMWFCIRYTAASSWLAVSKLV